MAAMPPGFPLEPVDLNGRRLSVGDIVRVASVASCARGLPKEDQERLYGIEGQLREIIDISEFGFLWLSFSATESSEDFSLFPTEVVLV